MTKKWTPYKEAQEGKWKEVDKLMQEFDEEDLLDDLREYDEVDLGLAYPYLTDEEADELYRRLQQ